MVEIKSFISRSPLLDLKIALGQYDIYKGFLEVINSERQLYLAISSKAYNTFFKQKAYQLIVERYQIPLLIVSVETEEIVKWTKPPSIAT